MRKFYSKINQSSNERKNFFLSKNKTIPQIIERFLFSPFLLKNYVRNSFRQVLFNPPPTDKSPISLLLKRIVWSLVFSVLSIGAQAGNLDSLIHIKSTCVNIEDCFQKTLDICEAARMNNNKIAFVENVPAIFYYMDTLNQNSTWVTELVKIGNGYRKFNEFSKADSLLQVALKYCSTQEELYNVYIELGYAKQRMGLINECLQVADTLFKQIDPNDPILERPDLYMLRGRCSRERRNTADALKDFLKVKELTKDIPAYSDLYLQADLYLSETYLLFQSYDSLHVLHQETRQKAHDSGDYIGELFAYYPIILRALELKNYEQALFECNRAAQLKNEHNVSTAFGFVYMCMAEAFIGLNQIDSAYYYVDKGISFSRESEEDKELADNLSVKVRLLIDDGKYQEAKIITEEAIGLRHLHDETLTSSYAVIQENLGNYKEAYLALQANAEELGKSNVALESRKIATILLEERFNVEQQQKESKFQLEMQSQNLRNAIGLLTVILFMIGGYLYQQMKNTSNLRQLNHSLKQHNEALEQFAFITSHDLKEPVLTISVFADLLTKKSDKFDKEIKDCVGFIKNSSQNLLRMIDSIKKFTTFSFTKHELETVNIQEVLDVVHQNLNQFIIKNNAVVEFNNSKVISTVLFSKELLTIILQNLIKNGIKYNESDPPKTEVMVFSQNRKALFKVKDNGIGIDEKFHDQIFVPFKSLYSKQDSDSSGLGLTICKNIIENHGGKIWVESNEESGSCFCFTI